MKHISSKGTVCCRVGWAGLLIVLLGVLSAAGEWSQAVKDAAARVAAGNASPADLQTVFEYNQSINRMGARGTQNGGINNQAYQGSQKAFTAKNNSIIQDSATECGLDVEIKEPKSDPLAGTDTDVNVKTKDGKPLTHEQWKRLNDTYNRKVNEYLKKPPGSKVNTGTDLMPDPKTTNPQEFQKICNDINNQGGTTYKDPAAARVEGAMAKGEPIVINEVGSYVKELQGQAQSHFDAAAKTTAEANNLAKVYGENSPQVQDLRAKAQIENSQGAKYIEKIENVGAKIRGEAGVAAAPGTESPSGKLTETLKNNRGADTIAQSEQIGPLSKNALNNATQSTIEDLARVANANPKAAPACQQAIADSLRDLPMSQKGQAMEMIKTKYGNDFAKGVAKAAQGPTGGATVMKGFEKVMKVLGPGLMIYDGYHRITGALNAPDEAKTYVAGKAIGGFVGGLGLGAAVGLGVAGILGAPVTAVGAAVVIGTGIIAGGLGYGVGDYAGSSLAGWMLEGVRPRDQSEYDALAAKGLLDGSKDIYGQLIAAGVDPATAAAAAAAYKNGDVKTFRDILASVRDKLVKGAKKMPPRRFNELATNEVEVLLDCLCSKSLGANPWVAQGYNTEIPKDADPKAHSCGSLANGPCMASGFGCWRSFIKWGNPGISDCLASFNLPTNSGYVRGEIDAKYQKPYEKPFKIKVIADPVEFCPNDKINVKIVCEGGRGDYEYRYYAGWPLQRPADGPKDAWTSTRSSSMTFTAPDLRRGYFDGQWVYTRPAEYYPTYVQVWARSTTFDQVSGQEVPTEICQSVGLRMRSHAECEKLHPPPPPETKKKPPTKPVTVSKPTTGTKTSAPESTGTAPPPTTPGKYVPPATTTPGGKKTTSGGKGGPASGSTPQPPPAPPSQPPPAGGSGAGGSQGPQEPGSSPKPPSSGDSDAGGSAGDSTVDCSFGGGATAMDNGPLNMWVEVPSNQRVRVTIKGSDGFSQTLEGVGRVDITRPRNPSGTDTITMENLDRPGCMDQQVAQYDTNGIPGGMPTSVNTNAPGLEGSEAGIGALPPDGTILSDPEGALGGFIGNKTAKGGERTDQGFETIKVTTDSQAKETSSDLDVAAAGHVVDVAGADAQDTKDATAKGTAKSDQETSWGKTLGDSIQKGFEDGVSAAATAFGSAAADKAAGSIFGGTKDKSDGEEGSSAGEGEQVAGGTTSAGGSSSGAAVGGSSGGGGGGGGSGSGGGAPVTTSLPISPTNVVGGGQGGTVTCEFCGYTTVVPPGGQPAPNCPVCGCGRDKALVTCSVCGYRWLVPVADGPPTGGCPKCGNGGPVTPDETGGAGAIAPPAVGVGTPATGVPMTPVTPGAGVTPIR